VAQGFTKGERFLKIDMEKLVLFVKFTVPRWQKVAGEDAKPLDGRNQTVRIL
jgi:hypothetical protein